MGIFSNLNPKLTNQESLATMAAYLPLSKKPQYNKTTAGQILKYVPIVAVFNMFKKNPLGPGEAVLGERFLDHVQGLDTGRRDVTQEAYQAARIFLTIAFGVRLTLAEDLDSLDVGVDAYLSRPNKKDIPRIAVERAVKLKKSYFSASTYNKGPWNLNYFESYPLVAPIPGIEPGTLYNGEIPGTGYAENGIPKSIDQEAPAPNPKAPVGASPVATGPVAPGAGSVDSASLVGKNAAKGQPGLAPWIKYTIIGLGAVVVILGVVYVVKKK